MTGIAPLNLITDVCGIRVGNTHDEALASGVTVLLTDGPANAAAVLLGGGPGTRELDALSLEGVVGAVNGIVLSGGSAFGLDAATGVQSYLRERHEGFPVGPARVPIVPQAILFDLLNGGDKNWGLHPPYRDMAYAAAHVASALFELGSAGAGYGATVALTENRRMRGGLGSASAVVPGVEAEDGSPITAGALVAVNAAGAVTYGDSAHFLAAPFEEGKEFGGRGLPESSSKLSWAPALKGLPIANTTLCILATDAILTRGDCKRLAIMAAAGMARAISPVFTPLDGDIVFALAAGKHALRDSVRSLALLGAAAAGCVTRAIARGVFEAAGCLPDGTKPYRELFPFP